MSILKRKTSTGWEEVTPSNPFQVPVEIVGGTQLPDLTNPGTAADLAQGKQLFDQNGDIVTGSTPIYSGVFSLEGEYPSREIETNQIGIWRTEPERIIIEENSFYGVFTDASWFGDAAAADVVKGKTFTSAAGLTVEGTYEPPTGGSDLIVSSSIDVLFSKTLSETTTSTTEVQIGPKIKMKQGGTCNIVVNGRMSSSYGSGTCYLYKNNTNTNKTITISGSTSSDKTFSNIDFNEDDTFYITVKSSNSRYTVTINSISITGTYKSTNPPTIAEEVTN